MSVKMKMWVPVACLLLKVVVAKHIQERSTDAGHQCEYNGIKYNEGESLPTHHLCLDCTCTKDFTEVNDRQCPVISCPATNHIEMGCMPVYNDTECCPVSWNCKNPDQKGKCDSRYFKHYQVQGCIPVFEEDNECPARFNCPKTIDVTRSKEECEYHGRLYKLGEDIPTSNPCEVCSCRTSYESGFADLSCIGVECPSLFRGRLNESCYDRFSLDQCCAVDTQCITSEPQTEKELTCEYGDQIYRYGEKIYPKEDPCLICLCSEKWTGVYGESCRVHECNLERKLSQLQRGCLPIYHESTCCPIEFYCGSRLQSIANVSAPVPNSADIESGHTCSFKGTNYQIGQVLDIQHPTNCVTCTCSTPPDFTCVHKQCPGPPNDDYVNCLPRFAPGQCCPTYQCSTTSARIGFAPVPVQCTPVHCPEGCKEVTVENSCPFCQCDKLLCSPPKCPSGCEVEKDVPKDRCPGCTCSGNTKVESRCESDTVKCPEFCMEVHDAFGCPSCMCGAVCTPPKCEPGCHLQRNVGKGECPRCECPDVPQLDPAKLLQCSPVNCPPMCQRSVSDAGCEVCSCQPMCSPPKCEPGCEIKSPSSPLACPYCACATDDSSVEQQLCSPVKCGPLCHEAYDGKGCPTCVCDIACSPPKCGPKCHLDYDPAISSCPVCVCDTLPSGELGSRCPNVTCGLMCHPKTGSDGCPTCECDQLCSAPKCGEGCHLEYDRATGPCPSCVCLSTHTDLLCSPVKCDEGCIESFGLNGCPTCICSSEDFPGVQCSMPKCDAGCIIDFTAKPCPTCAACPGEASSVQCTPPKCSEGCTIDFTSKPCPSCACLGEAPPLQCTQPKCDESRGCKLDFSTRPCPSCKCDKGPDVHCGVLNCGSNCEVNYDTTPCPTCVCTARRSPLKPLLQCSPPRCNLGCQIDYNAQPCPKCDCSGNSYLPAVMCSPPKCDAPCTLNFEAKPCPACTCPSSVAPEIMCSPPKCDPKPNPMTSCQVDFTAKPCPTCSCSHTLTDGFESKYVPKVMCNIPKCDVGCKVDYTTSPCPSCKCDSVYTGAVQCTSPVCDAGCRIDFSTTPCPSCNCESTVPLLQCSPPKCDAGCTVDFTAKPCPTCSCGGLGLGGGVPFIQCSPPKCGLGCTVDFTTKPCPSCSCGGLGLGRPILQCSPPKCESGCEIDFSSKPCPSCVCPKVPPVQCTQPRCDITRGCRVDFTTKPCPSCKCDAGSSVPTLQCSPPKCDPGCHIDYSSTPCPSCSCEGVPTLQCSPPKCEPGCPIDFSTKPCPSCNCAQTPACAIPKCNLGCGINYATEGCPTCVCDRYQRKFATIPSLYRDPFCETLSCGPGCERASTLSSPNERCPMCICRGATGESTKSCAAMRCQYPCQWKRVSEHACPSCVCMGMIV